jgi:hypothetical protein
MKMNTVQDNDDSIQLWQVHELKLFLQPPKVNPSGPAGQLAHIAAEQLSVIMLQVERYSQRSLIHSSWPSTLEYSRMQRQDGRQ